MRDDARADPYFAGPSIEDEAKGWMADELGPGEKVVWAGRPRLGLALLGLAPILGRGLLLVGLGLFWFLDGSRGGQGTGVFGWVAIAMGLASLPGAYAAARAATGARYLLTDRRAIIRAPGAGGTAEVATFGPDQLDALIRRQRPDGSGDLIFAETMAGPGSRARYARRGFLAIDDVRRVEDLVRSTLLARPAAK